MDNEGEAETLDATQNQENTNYVITAEAIQNFLQVSNRHHEPNSGVGFPSFDPDHSRVDISKWCADVDCRVKRDKLQDFDIIPRVQASLLGRAKSWYSKYGYQQYGWSDLRASLIHAFSSGADIVPQLRIVACSESNEFTSYSDYVMEKVSQINRLPFDIPEDKVVKVIVGCISDISLRNSLTFVMPTCVQSLIEHLSSIREGPKQKPEGLPSRRYVEKSKFIHADNELTPPPKRIRTTDEKRCYDCGKLGHIRSKCPNRYNLVSNVSKETKLINKSSEEASCKFCGKAGHTEIQCWAKQRAERKNVNLCSDVNSLSRQTAVVINGQLYHCLLDTGSDCCLIRNDIADKLPPRRRVRFLLVQGISAESILLTEELDVLVEFEDLIIEVNFHVIDKKYLKTEMIIGCDVLKDKQLEISTDFFGSTLHRKESFESAKSYVVDVPKKQSLLNDILNKYSSHFISGFPTSMVTTATFEIKLIQDANIHYRPYRMAPIERRVTAEIISELKEHGIVRDSNSPFASPIILVKKTNGQNRLVVDYRALNKVTVKDRYPLPRIDDQLDRLLGNSIFSSLDMASGFYQIPMSESSVEKTAFVTPDGHFEYLRLPFGLTNAPAAFQRAINKALGELKDTIALVYLDDVLIATKTVDENLKNLDIVLETLVKNGFSLNLQKCKFLQTEIEYLGREISADGIKPSKRKIDAVVNSPIPSNVRQVRQFMGLANYFRKFVPEFAAKTRCITSLTKKNVKFEWSDECEHARQYVIQKLVSRPVLAMFDPSLPTELHTDASSLGYGGILFQFVDKEPRVVAYYSQATRGSELNYHSYELETLAVVNAIKNFRHYLLGVKFRLVTDCNALKATQQKKDLLPRVARWWIYLQDFEFEIHYRKGQHLAHVDYLSRNTPVKNCQQVNVLSQTYFRVEQENDPATNELINKIKNHDTDILAQYKIKNGILFKKLRDELKIYVPQACRLSLIRSCHEENCHIGWEKTLNKLEENFWMPKMPRNVRKFVESCLVCLVAKRPSGKKQCQLYPIDKGSVPFKTIHVDFMGPFNEAGAEDFRYIFILVDAFTKFTLLFPCKTLTSAETVKTFNNFVALFGTPSKVISDRGTNFSSEEFKKLCLSLGIEHHMIAPGSCRANGQAERYVDTVSNLLRTNRTSLSWITYVSRVQLALNTSVNKSTGFSPLKLLTGISGRTPELGTLLSELDIAPQYENVEELREFAKKRLAENATRMKVRFDLNKSKPSELTIGEQVLHHMSMNE